VYCALDREFSEPILRSFETDTGIQVDAVFDTESTKSVGLAERILREKNSPQCDVFWNNEILNTLRLDHAGVLARYASPKGMEFAEKWRSPQQHWYGFAARARVLIVNTKRLGNRNAPSRLTDLTEKAWKGEVGIAKPLFGTTATQSACLFATWGPDVAKQWFMNLKANGVRILSGNKRVAEEVGAGVFTCGLTDTDDAAIEIAAGRSVELRFLDQEPDGLGSLVIPNTLARINGGQHPHASEKLIDYLLTPKVERRLSECPSKQIPLHPSLSVDVPRPAKPMAVDWSRALIAWEPAMAFLRQEFTT
jgi:iron(III) transport system substrate-binding protein